MTIIQAQPLKQFGISGPVSALDNEVPVFDGVTGKKVKAATGIICPSPGRLELSSTAPYLTFHNTTHEDTDYGRESELIFKGEQSGGEETTLGIIQVAHDGTADNQKGIMSFKVNDGNDGNAPGTAMTILANGNVGIGTDSPTNKLHIKDGVISIDNSTNSRVEFAGVSNLFGYYNSEFMMKCAGAFPIHIAHSRTSPPQDIKFSTDNTRRLTIKSTGNVGIGTTDPKGKLDIAGGISAGTYAGVTAPSTNGMIISGNVGIGIAIPTAKLDINSDIIRLRTAKTPASAGAAGNQGDECRDANYYYRCVATNTWKRTAITTW